MVDDAILQDLYVWVDKVPLSRVKKNISRDFSDGVLMAEVIKFFFPKYVDVHNFPTCNSLEAKKKNWQLLNWKVFKKLNFELSDDVISSLAIAKPGTIEKVLLLLRSKIDTMIADERGQVYDYRPEADRHANGGILVDRSRTPEPREKIKKSASFKAIQRASSPTIRGPMHKVENNFSSSRSDRDYDRNNEHRTSRLLDTCEFVPRSVYDEKVQECLNMEEAIEIMQAKIRRIENLLFLRDKRIDELQRKLANLR